jgi:hypothetical protein
MRTAVATLIVSACSFSPGNAGDQPVVDSGSLGDVGPIGSDGQSPGSNTMAPTCATPGSIQDNFAGPALSPQWLVSMFAGANVSVSGNNLNLQVGGGQASIAALTSRHAINLTGGVAEVETVSVLGGPDATTFSAGIDYTHYVSFNVEGGILATKIVANTTTTGTTVTFDPVQMKYWKFDQTGSDLELETSPDGSSWTSQFSTATPSWIDDAFLTLIATGNGSAGTAQLTNIDTQQPSAPWCSVDTLHDKFPANDEQWAATAPNPHCMFGYGTGAQLTQSMSGTCAFASSYAWDFTAAALVVKWGTITPTVSSSFEPTIAILADANPTAFDITVSNSMVCAPGMCKGYSFQPSGSDAYWQLAETGGNIVLSSSATGSNWTQILTVADPFTPVLGTIELGAITTDGTTDSVTFDAVN